MAGNKKVHIQGDREELGDTSQDHNDRNHKVDDPAATRAHELANSSPLQKRLHRGALELQRNLPGKPTYKLSEKSIVCFFERAESYVRFWVKGSQSRR